MKKLIFRSLSILSILFFTSTLFISCLKDNEKSSNQDKIDPIKVGILHNAYLSKTSKITNNLRFKSTDSDDELINTILSFDIEGLTYENKVTILNNISEITLEEIKNQTLSLMNDQITATHYYNQIDYAIDNSLTVEDLENAINNIVINIDNNLEGNDWNTIMAYAETSKASAKFWYPIDMGGTGEGFNIILSKSSELGISESQVRRKLPGWARADGRGAGYGMVGWAMTGGLGGPVGFLASTVISSVFSSADYASFE